MSHATPRHPTGAHPDPGELVALHFDEVADGRRETVARHAANCRACGTFLADLEAIELALGPGTDTRPPADGLERVLARVGASRPAAPRQNALKPILPSLGAVAGGVAATLQGGVVGGATFFLAGVLLTLALAPVLILESQRRTS